MGALCCYKHPAPTELADRDGPKNSFSVVVESCTLYQSSLVSKTSFGSLAFFSLFFAACVIYCKWL